MVAISCLLLHRGQVIDNKNFQSILELNPRVQAAIKALYSSKYAEGLAILAALRVELTCGAYLTAVRSVVEGVGHTTTH